LDCSNPAARASPAIAFPHTVLSLLTIDPRVCVISLLEGLTRVVHTTECRRVVGCWILETAHVPAERKYTLTQNPHTVEARSILFRYAGSPAALTAPMLEFPIFFGTCTGFTADSQTTVMPPPQHLEESCLPLRPCQEESNWTAVYASSRFANTAPMSSAIRLFIVAQLAAPVTTELVSMLIIFPGRLDKLQGAESEDSDEPAAAAAAAAAVTGAGT